MELLRILNRSLEYRTGFRLANGSLKTGFQGIFAYLSYGLKNNKFRRFS